MRNFWRHINQYYFKKIEAQDLERVDYLTNLLNYPIKGTDTASLSCNMSIASSPYNFIDKF